MPKTCEILVLEIFQKLLAIFFAVTSKRIRTFLIRRYKTLDDIFKNFRDLKHIDSGKYSKVADILLKNEKVIYMSKKLVTLNTIDEMELNQDKISPDLNELIKFLNRVGVSKNTIKTWDRFITCQ